MRPTWACHLFPQVLDPTLQPASGVPLVCLLLSKGLPVKYVRNEGCENFGKYAPIHLYIATIFWRTREESENLDFHAYLLNPLTDNRTKFF
jgi:hypothetical protein